MINFRDVGVISFIVDNRVDRCTCLDPHQVELFVSRPQDERFLNCGQVFCGQLWGCGQWSHGQLLCGRLPPEKECSCFQKPDGGDELLTDL